MTFRIELTRRARQDLDQILGTLAEKAPDAAGRLAIRFEQALGRLERHPAMCGFAHENPRFHEDIRHLLFGIRPGRKYRALFVIRGEDVVILAIRAPGQKPVRPDDFTP